LKPGAFKLCVSWTKLVWDAAPPRGGEDNEAETSVERAAVAEDTSGWDPTEPGAAAPLVEPVEAAAVVVVGVFMPDP
jgi:hypothetical protein